MRTQISSHGYELARLAVSRSNCSVLRTDALLEARAQTLRAHEQRPLAVLARTLGLGALFKSFAFRGDELRPEEQRGISGPHNRALVPLTPTPRVSSVIRSALGALGGGPAALRAGLTPAAWLVELSVLIALPGASAQPPHVDVLPRDGLSMATIFVPLQDTVSAMGATILYPACPADVATAADWAAMQQDAVGSRSQGRVFESDGMDAVFGTDSETVAQIRAEAAEDAAASAGLAPPVASNWSRYSAATFGLGKPIVMEMTAGDALLMDYRCFHHGGANSSSKLRALLYATFSEEHSTSPEDLHAHGSHRSYSIPAELQSHRLADFL